MPITNQDRNQSHGAPCNSFYGCTLKAHLSIYRSLSAENTCTLGTKDSAKLETGDVPSKYQLNQDVWLKVGPHTKWMAGKISQILPNQSHVVSLSDGCTFHWNEHHITRRLSCIKPRATNEADETSHSYNLRSRKTQACTLVRLSC